MSVRAWVVVVVVAGALAERATGRRSSGCLTRIAIGIVGALVGGAIANAAGEKGVNDFSLWSLLLAFAGASVLLLVFGAIDKR
jgi:uncharacterized membrane protein YeaQ/YmgE (transglycosylase-associated protein family)